MRSKDIRAGRLYLIRDGVHPRIVEVEEVRAKGRVRVTMRKFWRERDRERAEWRNCEARYPGYYDSRQFQCEVDEQGREVRNG